MTPSPLVAAIRATLAVWAGRAYPAYHTPAGRYPYYSKAKL